MGRKGSLIIIATAVLAAPTTALADLEQPSGQPIPTEPGCNSGQPTGLAATFACVCVDDGVCNIGEVCTDPNNCDDAQNSTCETTMAHFYNDNTCIPQNVTGLDVYGEAAVVPETFKPTCPQTFSLLSRGTAIFGDAFGWYNVTGSAPTPDELHVMLDCTTDPGDEVVLDLQSEPDYAGGEIGFFIITPEAHSQAGTCAGGDCCATPARLAAGVGYAYYSERQYNPDFNGAESYIHLLTYGSHVWESKFYFAWEDIFGGSNGDFTDIVTGVSGLQCSGGGIPCDTGEQGKCGLGLTVCHGADLVCEPLFESVDEACNGVDDDCDGTVDDDATCPEEGEICHQGKCVHPCDDGEFPCTGETLCDEEALLCVHPSCIDVSCEGGTVCREGDCVEPCDGIICPHGQHCLADKCLDLCDDVSCGQDEVCVEGKCLPGCTSCAGLTCEQPLSCDTGSGKCIDDSCADPCPDGTYCDAGECKDPCDGAVCPGSEQCIAGYCGGPGTGGAGGGELPGVGGEGTGAGSATGGAGEGGDASGADDDGSGSGSCACGAGPSHFNPSVLFLFGVPGFGGALLRGRRRH